MQLLKTKNRLMVTWLKKVCLPWLERHLSRNGKASQFAIDALVTTFAVISAYNFRFEFDIPLSYWKQMVLVLPYAVLLHLGANFVFGVYRILWRYVSLIDVLKFVKSIGVVTLAFLALRLFHPIQYVRLPLSVIFMEAAFSFLGMLGVRFLRRYLYETSGRSRGPRPHALGDPERVLIVGAGDNARTVAREIRLRRELGMELVGFVDDDPTKQGQELEGGRVLGSLSRITELHRIYGFSRVLLAIPELPIEKKRRLHEECSRLGVRLLLLPGTSELITGRARVSMIREVAIEDLLGRPVREIARDDPLLQPVYGGKTVLVTGAGGSIGSELCRQVARVFPRRFVLVEKDETLLFEIRNELARLFPEIEIVARVLDIRNVQKLEALLAQTRPHVVLHAAAYKHVPLMEENPDEAVENNVFGTQNVANLAAKFGAQVFVMLSTDKAVKPTSIMGATKRVAELIVRHMAVRYPDTRFGSVRFGNVLGSRGSVIPIFREQIARGGPVTVTHPEVMRYFMTIPEASQLVLKAGTLAREGEIFVLDMGSPIKILDLARDMIRLSGFEDGEIEIRFIGLRPGEKLVEELLVEKDKLLPTPVEKVFVTQPELRDFKVFEEQLKRLMEAARSGSRAEIWRCLEEMDIGLRPPDGGTPVSSTQG